VTGDAALELVDVHAGYGSADILHGLSLTVADGGVTALLGANGAGKSTTLRAISGVIPSRGEIRLYGSSISGLSPEAVARRGVAHVPEGRGTFPRLTVEENLRVGALTQNRSRVTALVDRWLDYFPRLADRRNQRAGNLSGGEQQMLAIARGMMLQPRLLLLDEPSMGLAPNLTADLFQQLAQLNADEGVSILVVEQNANLALATADFGFVLEAGRITVHGPARELAADPGVRRAYLHV
jgi:branched-chain amino acid transport system ATP-binding protein